MDTPPPPGVGGWRHPWRPFADQYADNAVDRCQTVPRGTGASECVSVLLEKKSMKNCSNIQAKSRIRV